MVRERRDFRLPESAKSELIDRTISGASKTAHCPLPDRVTAAQAMVCRKR